MARKSISFFTPSVNLSKVFESSLFKVGIDYERYAINDLSILNFFNKFLDINDSNTNVAYCFSGALVRTPSNNGEAYQFIIAIEGIGPVPIFFIELYSASSAKFTRSLARIDFYGAFFHFQKIVSPEIQAFYNQVLAITRGEGKANTVSRRTRVDLAFDFDCSFPQDLLQYFHKAPNSKRDVKPYVGIDGLQSVGYIPEKNRGYGVRIYNKPQELITHNKTEWYPNAPKNWTRVEFELNGKYAGAKNEELENWLGCHTLGTNYSSPPPVEWEIKSAYSPQNAYDYFTRYCKNNSITFDQLINDVLYIHSLSERDNKRSMYGLR